MDWKRYNPPEDVKKLLEENPKVTIVSSSNELMEMACGGKRHDTFDVFYEVPGFGKVVEATVARVRNGISVNYTTSYMRRRDPDALIVGDNLPTDKPTFREVYGYDFSVMRAKTFDWLKKHPLIMYGFTAGRRDIGLDALVIVPANAGFFAFGLALLQGIIAYKDIPEDFHPKAVVYVAPTFRYTDFGGKQVVVHHRMSELYEIFSYNLYPGPSAKKGIYGVLIDLGEREGWVAPHCSAVKVVTPYDNEVTIMHEGASGGGKSEMLEQVRRESDGRLLIGENILTGERRYQAMPRSCDLYPVCDDMALCHPSLKSNPDKLSLMDAEDAWFVRTNHIAQYGDDMALERLTAKPEEPLLFLNIDAAPGSRAMIWEHIEDEPGKPCPNPRVTIPRRIIPGVVDGPVSVDIRSFGVRTPPCTREKPSYGIIGFFHLLPPALAWLWRLVAPRGYDNPSVIDNNAIASEGVGSYWPFATGLRVRQANLLLAQFVENPRTRYVLIPNQYVGAWKVGFMPQWIAREYLARHGSARFRPDQLRASRCSLLGSTLHQLHLEGSLLSRWFLQVETQPEVGEEAYDTGAAMLYQLFENTLRDFLKADLDALGKEIITCCLDKGTVVDYERLLPGG
ncbi:MAG: DUF4914 family protein [Anaerolineae bacterium]|nr:DUF4914 family protein [Anaerolineae bacterium]